MRPQSTHVLVGWLVGCLFGWLFKNLKSCLEIGPSLRVGGRARSILALFSLIQLTTSQLYFCVFIYLFIYFITREVCFIKIKKNVYSIYLIFIF